MALDLLKPSVVAAATGELALTPRNAEVVASRYSCTQRLDPSLRLAARSILASVEGSRYHTLSAAEACLLLLLSPDTSTGECDPVPPQWDGGRNHLVLSLHPAPCPRTFQLGQAMVAEASPTVDTFRPGFDVALPLLPEAHPLRGGVPGQLRQHSPRPGVALLALAEDGGRWHVAGTDFSACPWDGRCEQDRGPKQ